MRDSMENDSLGKVLETHVDSIGKVYFPRQTH